MHLGKYILNKGEYSCNYQTVFENSCIIVNANGLLQFFLNISAFSKIVLYDINVKKALT